jgi:eukaryotic-like serine/threonine-protein kinase
VQVVLMQVNGTPDPLPADVPDGVRRLVDRMVAKDPEERFADGAALLTAVEDLLAQSAEFPEPDRDETTILPVAPTRPDPARRGTTEAGTSPRSRHAAPSRRRSRGLLIGLVGVLALLAVVATVLTGWTGAPAPSAEPTATPATAGTIRISTGDFLGKPVGDVEALLTSLGFPVQLQAVQTVDAPDGAVLDVDPSGEVSPGQMVTVTYAVPPPAPAPAAEQGRVADPGAGTQTVEPGDTATQPSPAPETTAGPGNSGRAPSSGRGNGRGND